MHGGHCEATRIQVPFDRTPHRRLLSRSLTRKVNNHPDTYKRFAASRNVLPLRPNVLPRTVMTATICGWLYGVCQIARAPRWTERAQLSHLDVIFCEPPLVTLTPVVLASFKSEAVDDNLKRKTLSIRSDETCTRLCFLRKKRRDIKRCSVKCNLHHNFIYKTYC